jgi:hypothetical protein
LSANGPSSALLIRPLGAGKAVFHVRVVENLRRFRNVACAPDTALLASSFRPIHSLIIQTRVEVSRLLLTARTSGLPPKYPAPLTPTPQDGLKRRRRYHSPNFLRGVQPWPVIATRTSALRAYAPDRTCHSTAAQLGGVATRRIRVEPRRVFRLHPRAPAGHGPSSDLEPTHALAVAEVSQAPLRADSAAHSCAGLTL